MFDRALDECITRKVDFILIPGDIFHVNIPEMRVQKYAFAQFRKVHDAGIPIYVVYGSHDYSPVANSVIDLLAEVGYVTKVTKASSNKDNSILLDFFVDKKTGAKITGLSGLKVGRDRDWYESLDRDSLESEPGFKIFLFHGGISDMKTDSGMDGEHMPLSLLPRGFSYYAGGHMHKWNHQEFSDYPHVVYPGTIFAGYHADLEENARGQKRGFALVEFEDRVQSVEFVELENTQYEIIEVDADGRKAESVSRELREKADSIDAKDKIVIIQTSGELTSGKTADVDVSGIRSTLSDAGSTAVLASKRGLTSKEYDITSARGSNREEIESNVFSENIGQMRLENQSLTGTRGVELAKKLLGELGQAKQVNESKTAYENKVRDGALAILGLDKDDT